MKIKVNGNEEEAYALIMQRKYAEQILDGTKTVEKRSFTSKYVAMFLEKFKLDSKMADPDAVIDESCLRDVRYVHFYTRNVKQPWHLDCRIDNIGFARLAKGDAGMEHLAKDFNYHELDDEMTDDADNAQVFFYLHIAEVVGQSGLR